MLHLDPANPEFASLPADEKRRVVRRAFRSSAALKRVYLLSLAVVLLFSGTFIACYYTLPAGTPTLAAAVASLCLAEELIRYVWRRYTRLVMRQYRGG
jgi:hypothetical protein